MSAPALIFMALSGSMTGVAIGILQQRVLRKQIYLIAPQWVWVNLIGWSIGCAVSEFSSEAFFGTLVWPIFIHLETVSILPLIIVSGVAGLTGGAITGIPLVRMLQQSESISS